MFPRASSLTVLSRGTRYLFRPTNTAIRLSSLSARAFSAVHAAMADTSGITADSLQAKLISELQADHVEIEDLSGMKNLHLWIHCWRRSSNGNNKRVKAN